MGNLRANVRGNYAKKEKIMLSYLMVFSAGALVGSMLMGLYVAFINKKDARDDW